MRAASRATGALTIALAIAPLAAAHATGQLYCREGPISPHESAFSTDAPPFTMSLADGTTGEALTTYIPDATQTWSLTASSPANFGFIVAAFSGTTADVGTGFIEGSRLGALIPRDGASQRMLDDGVNDCTMGLTHTLNNSKSVVTADFTAPTAGTGTITFFAIVVTGQFDHPFRVYATFNEGAAPSATASASASPAASPAASPSGTPAPTVTASVTPTKTNPSRAPTPPKTPSKTSSKTKSVTPTKTVTKTSTKSPTTTKTGTKTGTPSKTPTRSTSGTPPGTRSSSGTKTASAKAKAA